MQNIFYVSTSCRSEKKEITAVINPTYKVFLQNLKGSHFFSKVTGTYQCFRENIFHTLLGA